MEARRFNIALIAPGPIDGMLSECLVFFAGGWCETLRVFSFWRFSPEIFVLRDEDDGSRSTSRFNFKMRAAMPGFDLGFRASDGLTFGARLSPSLAALANDALLPMH